MPRPTSARTLTVYTSTALILAALACGGNTDDVKAEFRAARDAAMAPVGPAPKGWAPDAVLQLSPDLVDRLVASGIEQLEPSDWDIDAPGVKLTPKLSLTDVTLSASKTCDDCFAAKVEVTGPIRYDAGILGKGRIPTTITATLDVGLDVGKKSDGFPVMATIEEVRRVQIDLEGIPKVLTDKIEPKLTDLVHDEVKRSVDPFQLARPGSDALPLRALRVKPQGAGVLLEMLTEAGTDASVVPGRALGDWTLDVAEPSLVRIVARQAFAAGPQDLGLFGELKHLDVPRSGKLHLDVRVWRTEGNGWWRDLSVQADATMKGRSLELEATKAEVVASSPGAAFADPVAWLAESLVLSEIEEAAAFAVPAVERADVGQGKVVVKLEGLAPGSESLRSYGSVTLR